MSNNQMENVISAISSTGKAYEEWLFNVKDESEKLEVLLTPVIMELMEKQIEDTTNFISG